MFLGKLFDALQFNYEPIIHHQISEVFAYRSPFVYDRIRSLSLYHPPAKLQFALQRAFIHLLQEPAAQRIRNFVGSSYNVLDQQFKRFAFISVHSRPMMG